MDDEPPGGDDPPRNPPARVARGTGGSAHGSPGEVFRVALQLGLTSFGGPIAHLGYFHREYVVRRRWVSESTYADLVALCQFLPGPASSQVGFALGLLRAGWAGAVAAWVGFTLPSALALTGFALLATRLDIADAPWVHGLNLAAVAVVATAVLSMVRTLTPDRSRRTLAILASGLLLATQSAALQVVVIIVGGLVGWWLFAPRRGSGVTAADASGVAGPSVSRTEAGDGRGSPVSTRAGLVALGVFVVLLAGLPLLRAVTGSSGIAVADSFYRAGALVFGGGHVVLPLLADLVVAPGWVTQESFVAGYGAAQAVPGPLFTFAAFLGASLSVVPSGVGGAALATVAIFLPGLLLVVSAVPFWDRLRQSATFRGVLAGTNAAVVGLLGAALYDPVWTAAVTGPLDVALVGLAFGALAVWDVPPWLVVVGLAGAAQLISWVSG